MDEQIESGLIIEMIAASATGEPQRAGELLAQIAESRPTGDMFPVCCAVASVGHQAMVMAAGGVVPGGMFWAPEPNPGEPAEVEFARRFLAAWANGDVDICRALYGARNAEPGYALADSVIALIVFVGKLGNELIDGRPAA